MEYPHSTVQAVESRLNAARQVAPTNDNFGAAFEIQPQSSNS